MDEALTTIALRSAAVAGGGVALVLPLALWASHRLAQAPGKHPILENAVQLPLVLPPVITGLVLLRLLSPASPVGAFLVAVGLRVPFTAFGAALAAGLMALPLMVTSMRIGFSGLDISMEEAYVMEGGSRWMLFRYVTFPLTAHAVLAGLVLGFGRALGEFGATIVVAGNIPGRTTTLPLAIYGALNRPGSERALWTLVGVSVAMSMVTLAVHAVLSRRLYSHRGAKG